MPLIDEPLTDKEKELVSEYYLLACKTANSFSRRIPFLKDEFESCIVDGLLKAAKKYIRQSHFSMALYVRRAVQFQCLEVIDTAKTRSVRHKKFLDHRHVLSFRPNVNDFDGMISFLSNSRERQILKYRFVEGMTQKEVGQKLGFSRQRADRLEKEAISKLYDYMTSRVAS